jgi:hypothetical protein
MRSDLHDIPIQLLAESEKAWKLSDGTQEDWFPKSQCELDLDTKTLTAPEWLLKDKGWL